MARSLTGGIQSLWVKVMAPHPGEPPDGVDVAAQAASMAPVVWLIGKVQSGKTSIVRTLTGASDAEIGSGFRPTTRTARVFDYPAEAPVIRFLDTRGLGEASYDPADDIAVSEEQAHLVLAVMRALDHEQSALLENLIAIRERHPDWPIVIAQTSLHDAYPHGHNHPLPYPFAADGRLPASASALLPENLVRSLAHQRTVFSRLPGRAPVLFVAIDFTQEGDGFDPREYGLQALTLALETAAPAGLEAALTAVIAGRGDALAQRAQPHVIGYATAAAAADLVPLAGLVAVPGVQAKMLHSLARIYRVNWDRRATGEFAAAIGTGALVRMASVFGLREAAKLVPVYGQTAGAAAAAAASFATTYALGKAACYFLARRRSGQADPEGVAAAYRDGLAAAFKLARERGLDKATAHTATAAKPAQEGKSPRPPVGDA